MTDLKQIAEIALAATRTGQRIFRLDHDRLKLMGLSSDDIGKVERIVRDIEQYTFDSLNALDRP